MEKAIRKEGYRVLRKDILAYGVFDVADLEYMAEKNMSITYKNFCKFVNWLFDTEYDFSNSQQLKTEFDVLRVKYKTKYL